MSMLRKIHKIVAIASITALTIGAAACGSDDK